MRSLYPWTALLRPSLQTPPFQLIPSLVAMFSCVPIGTKYVYTALLDRPNWSMVAVTSSHPGVEVGTMVGVHVQYGAKQTIAARCSAPNGPGVSVETPLDPPLKFQSWAISSIDVDIRSQRRVCYDYSSSTVYNWKSIWKLARRCVCIPMCVCV